MSTLIDALRETQPLEPFNQNAFRYSTSSPEGEITHVLREGSAGDHVLVMSARRGFNEAQAAAILAAVGDIPPDFFDENPLRILPATLAKSPFDILVLLGPEAHRHFEKLPDLQEQSAVVFPAYACEFSGTEEVSVMRTLRKYFVSTLDWDRPPQPRLLAMHRNEKTGSRSPGQKRGLARFDKTLREIESLPAGAANFVEVENLWGHVLKFQRSGETLKVEPIEPPSTAFELAPEKASSLLTGFLIKNSLQPR
jgi:hypothetical protein